MPKRNALFQRRILNLQGRGGGGGGGDGGKRNKICGRAKMVSLAQEPKVLNSPLYSPITSPFFKNYRVSIIIVAIKCEKP